MNSKTLVHICLGGLFALAVIYVMGQWNTTAWQENPMYAFLAIILLAVSGGIFFVLVVLPRMGDAIGTMMYSSGEEVSPDETMKAAAKMATGDYEGAIDEYEKMLREKPEDPFPISEIAKIRAEKLGDRAGAIDFLQTHLEDREWSEDNAAFLMFRIVELHTAAKAYDEAKDILEQVVGNFPGTRHSANAKHKINELEQTQFRELQAQRAKQSSSGSA
jgi:tetratricopeptide (TPR) repeat protein